MQSKDEKRTFFQPLNLPPLNRVTLNLRILKSVLKELVLHLSGIISGKSENLKENMDLVPKLCREMR